MQTLRDYGFNFSLDDFGTGYSSLSYLKNLPFNELKIDKTFVSDLSGSEASCDIAYIIILMGKMLGMKVVAEGVETKEQLQKLQDMGCQYYQGYLFSRPILVDQLVKSITG
jgi:EAL domain-containing protein (putative c-di-GMP-specific phosphodiesterase class I)